MRNEPTNSSKGLGIASRGDENHPPDVEMRDDGDEREKTVVQKRSSKASKKNKDSLPVGAKDGKERFVLSYHLSAELKTSKTSISRQTESGRLARLQNSRYCERRGY